MKDVKGRIHVAFFNRSYAPDETATARLLTELCEDLVALHGWRVTVVTGVPPGCVPGRAELHGVQVVRVRGTQWSKAHFIGRATNYVSYFVSALRAGRRLDSPDVIVSLTDPPIVGLAAWRASRRFAVPLVMAFNDIFPEVAVLLPTFRSQLVNAALQRVNEFLVRRAAVNIALGDTMRQRLIDGKGAPPERTVVIPSWADTSLIVPGPKDNAFARTHGLVGRFVVMHSGNLGLSQELETLVDAAALLQDRQDVVFVLQGDGVQKPVLEQLVRTRELTNVRFLPFASRDDVSQAFASADVFIVALRRGLAGYIVPSKIYGILAAGRPYVAAVEDDCEVASLTRAHHTGLVVEPGNAKALADGIRQMHESPELRTQAGAASRSLAASFDRRVQVARYADLLRGAVS